MATGRIITLVENTAGKQGLLGEHGLSYWIELDEATILFDTGQGMVLRHNAERLGIALEAADAIVLSHGHYDHTGGLADVLSVPQASTICIHPAAFEAKYARNFDGSARPIGMMDLDEEAIRSKAKLVLTEEPTDIAGGLRVTGTIPRTTDFEDTGGAFFADSACTTPDLILDDQAAFIETPAGTVAILGCAHAGVINTLRHIQALTDGQPIHTVMGGMHLLHADANRMDKTVAELRRLDIQRLIPCHCTGPAAVARLWNEFPGRCWPCPTGTFTEIPS